MTDVGDNLAQHTEDWQALPWKQFQRDVFRLQKRIYQAVHRDDLKQLHNLQRRLLHSWSAQCLAVRQVSQDNRGKRTPGVDGVASLTPEERLALAHDLQNLSSWTADPIRRVYIPKPGRTEKRGLGIPTMRDRAMQALVKLALEPEWEARFESNSYGFRPGRSAHDAIEAIFASIHLKSKFVLDTDVEKCFDRINHDALLKKLNTIQPIKRVVHQWLKAGIMEQGQLLFPETGTPQGGVISPLLANIALHGLEETLVRAAPYKYPAAVIRYADDLVVLCIDLDTLLKLQKLADAWLAGMGLRLKPSKTRITHTLNEYEGNLGFDFLGFHVRQYRVSKYHTRTYRGQPGFKTLIKPSDAAIQRHLRRIKGLIRQHRGAPQAALIATLNPVIRGWTNYYKTCVAKRVFNKMDHLVHRKLYQWASRRHRNKTHGWRKRRYWRHQGGRDNFSDGSSVLTLYSDTRIVRHVKVRGKKSPYDGDWVYWGRRLGRDPTKPKRVIQLLKQQQSHCAECGLHFMAEDIMEVHHQDGNQNNNQYDNLALLHGHCHDEVHRERCQ